MSAMQACAHCGTKLQDQGSGFVRDQPVCHPDVGMDCYRLVTVYDHPLPCRACRAVREVDLAPACVYCDSPIELLVRQYPKDAAMMLQAMGYDVVPPSGTVL